MHNLKIHLKEWYLIFISFYLLQEEMTKNSYSFFKNSWTFLFIKI
jgi:hypothetical protein